MPKSPVIIIDSDGLIALLNPSDKHAKRALEILETLNALGARILHPVTVITETATTFQRRLGKPKLAGHLLNMIKDGQLPIETVDERILEEAMSLFDPKGSKKNTLFDAVVAAVAKKRKADAIFSFDGWYKKLGFQRVGDYLEIIKASELEKKPEKGGITLGGLKKKYKL